MKEEVSDTAANPTISESGITTGRTKALKSTSVGHRVNQVVSLCEFIYFLQCVMLDLVLLRDFYLKPQRRRCTFPPNWTARQNVPSRGGELCSSVCHLATGKSHVLMLLRIYLDYFLRLTLRSDGPKDVPNCQLSDILQRDLLPNVDYVYDADYWLFAWDNYSPECIRLANEPVHDNTIGGGEEGGIDGRYGWGKSLPGSIKYFGRKRERLNLTIFVQS